MLLKLFVSMPMAGRDTADIIKDMKAYQDMMEEKYGGPMQLCDSVTTAYINSLDCLGSSIKEMSDADIIFFAKGWENTRGCRIEELCARKYSIAVREYEEPETEGLGYKD